MGNLEEPVPQSLRPNPYRLKKDVVAGIASGHGVAYSTCLSFGRRCGLRQSLEDSSKLSYTAFNGCVIEACETQEKPGWERAARGSIGLQWIGGHTILRWQPGLHHSTGSLAPPGPSEPSPHARVCVDQADQTT